MNNPYFRTSTRNRKTIAKHTLIWNLHKGEILNGYEIHHKNGKKTDNRIRNLEVLTIKDHRRIHAGFIKRMGVWKKCCPFCKKYKTLDNFWFRSNGKIITICKKCKSEYNRYQCEKRD